MSDKHGQNIYFIEGKGSMPVKGKGLCQLAIPTLDSS